MPRISELPLIDAIAAGDKVPVLDVSDLSQSPDGTTKHIDGTALIPTENLTSVVTNGADPTGVADSTAAFQSAIDSNYAVYVPYGKYRIDGTLVIDEEKTIVCERGILPNPRWFVSAAQSPFNQSNGVMCRLFKDEASTDSNFFKIRWGGVSILGFPVLDVSDRASYTSAGVFYAPNETNPNTTQGRMRGWGGWLELICLGNQDTISNAGEGMNCVEVDWSSPADQGSYMAQMDWKIYAQNVGYCLYLPALDATGGQFANSLNAEIYVDYCKQAVFNRSFNASRFSGLVQARGVLDATEHPKAVIDNDQPRVEIDILAYDLTTTADGNGHYLMSYLLESNGRLGQVKIRSADSFASIQGDYLPRPSEVLYSPQGVVPHFSTTHPDGHGGLFISSIGNELMNVTLAGTVSIAAYDGTGSPDFDNMTDDSVTEGVSTSSDITITNASNFNLFEATKPTFQANATAVTDEDYVEIVIDFSYRSGKLWITYDGNGGLDKIQVITKNGAAVVDNITATGGIVNDEDPALLVDFALSGAQCDKTIIRLIGFKDSGKVVTLYDVAAARNDDNLRGPLITTQGGKTIYGDMVMAANVDFTGLPTSDPAVAGRLWNNGGVVTVSAG